MWFMNKVANPIVKLLLRSPLHGWLSASVLLITYRGRKSGQEYTLPVQYVQDDDTIYIVPGYAEKKTWWRNLAGGLDVRVTLKGQTRRGTGILLHPAAGAGEIFRAFDLYLQRFPPAAQIHHVRLAADGRPDPADLREAAKSIKMIRVQLEGSSK